MKNKLFIFLIILFTISCSDKKKKTTETDTISIETRFQKALDSIYNAHTESVGIMIHIESPSKKLFWSGAVGYSDQEEKTALQINQPFLIASNTKTFVATTILRLVEQDRLDVNATIDNYLTKKTRKALKAGGYDPKVIKIKHLLSHTSGINDFVDANEFEQKISSDPQYRWTRDEQIALATANMKKLGSPGDIYKYSDTNYLLLSEIIEEVTNLPFYKAIRELIDFEKQELYQTWFASLEEEPKDIIPLAHQYVGKWGLDSHQLNKSFDLYGGGGLASTTEDLASFFYNLFNNKVLENPETLDLLLTEVFTKDKKVSNYYFGIWKSTINGKTVYGHGGFWGSMAFYVPELDMAFSVVVLEKDKAKLRKEIAKTFIEVVMNS